MNQVAEGFNAAPQTFLVAFYHEATKTSFAQSYHSYKTFLFSALQMH